MTDEQILEKVLELKEILEYNLIVQEDVYNKIHEELIQCCYSASDSYLHL